MKTRGLRDLLVASVAFAALAGTSLLSGILAARLLGPEGRGELAAVLLWVPLIATLGGLAITDAIVYLAAKRETPPERIFAAAMALGALLALVLSALALAVLPLVYAGYPPEVRAVARLYLLFIPLSGLASYGLALFQGGLRLGVWNFLRVFVAAAYVVFIAAFALAGEATVRGFAIASLLANAATLALALVLLARAGWIGWRPDLGTMKRLVRYGLPVHLGVVAIIINEKLDQMLISLWQDAATFSFYVVSLGMVSTVYGFVGLLAALAFPKVAGQPTDAGRATVLGRYMRLALGLSLPALAALILLAPWLITLLYGAPFRPAAPLIQVLALGAIGYACKTMFVQGLKAYDRTGAIGRTEAMTLAINAVALVVLLPRFGILGAAWAYVLAQSAGALLYALAARRTLDLDLGVVFRPCRDDVRRLSAGLRALRR